MHMGTHNLFEEIRNFSRFTTSNRHVECRVPLVYFTADLACTCAWRIRKCHRATQSECHVVTSISRNQISVDQQIFDAELDLDLPPARCDYSETCASGKSDWPSKNVMLPFVWPKRSISGAPASAMLLGPFFFLALCPRTLMRPFNPSMAATAPRACEGIRPIGATPTALARWHFQ